MKELELVAAVSVTLLAVASFSQNHVIGGAAVLLSLGAFVVVLRRS